jgi:YegS/Rv2252/BmrU family lipid kinase
MFRKKTQVIVNPESNQGKTRKRWKQIKEALMAFLSEFKCEFTEKPSQATEISRHAIKEGTELIVGVGGDGTINEIANGFYENLKIINPETKLGILPSGTGCDLSRSLRIPKGYGNAMRVITQNTPSNIDVGRIRFMNHKGQEEDRVFLNITDFGFGGEVVKKMDDQKIDRKASSYLKSVISTFLHYKAKKLRIKVDGQEIPLDEYMIGAVSNGQIFGKGMKIAPEAELDDGVFDLILVKRMKLFEFLRNVLKLYSGTHLSHPKVSMVRGQRIEAFPAVPGERVLIEVDGEQLGCLPADFEIMPKSFPVHAAL